MNRSSSDAKGSRPAGNNLTQHFAAAQSRRASAILHRSNSDNSGRSSSSYVLSLDGERYDLSNLKPSTNKLSSTGQLYPDVSDKLKKKKKSARRHSDGAAMLLNLQQEPSESSSSSDSCNRVVKSLARSISDSLDVGLHLSDDQDSDKDSRNSNDSRSGKRGAVGVGIVGIGIQATTTTSPYASLSIPAATSPYASLSIPAAANPHARTTGEISTMHPSSYNYLNESIVVASSSSTSNLHAPVMDTELDEKLSTKALRPSTAASSGTNWQTDEASGSLLPMFNSSVREMITTEELYHSSTSSHTSHSDYHHHEEAKKPKAHQSYAAITEEVDSPASVGDPTANPAAATVADNDSTRGGGGDYLAVSVDEEGKPYLQIGPNVRIGYVGTNAKTKAAIRNGDRTIKSSCLTCESIMTCLPGLEYVVCEACHTINPTILMMETTAAATTMSKQGKGAGIGLVASKKPSPRSTSGEGSSTTVSSPSSPNAATTSPPFHSARSA